MIRTITARDLKARLNDGSELALLDVREAGEFGESHLLFATPLPYSRLEFEVGTLVPRRGAPIVLCDDGTTGVAQQAAARLAAMGYTDVAILERGTAGWAAAGYVLFAGVNVPSKTFGELVEHAYHTPRITAQDLVRMKETGEDFVIVDGRPYAEYRKMSIPGGICCPNGELAYRIRSLVKNPQTKIVVNCAGRTRSIIGAQTLINVGVKNPVYALENGTQGWFLADLALEHGADRKYPDTPDAATLAAARDAATALMKKHGVAVVPAATLQTWLADATRTTYVLDVRTPEEYARGTLPGAVHAPGGQLIQATDQWVGVRNARIVLADDDGIRAPVVASWLAQLGCTVAVLDGGIRAGLSVPRPAPAPLPALDVIAPPALQAELAAGRVCALDVGASMRYRGAHVPGSRWSIRRRVVADARAAGKPVVFIADETDVARAAARELHDAGMTDVRLLAGGFAAWQSAGLPVAATPDTPADDQCIDYLFFVHDRHAGNRAAMRQYLAWETGLLAQLDADDRRTFRIPETH